MPHAHSAAVCIIEGSMAGSRGEPYNPWLAVRASKDEACQALSMQYRNRLASPVTASIEQSKRERRRGRGQAPPGCNRALGIAV